jgi:hypothetical protein
MTRCTEWAGVDMASFLRCDVWRRPDLFQALLHLGPLVGQTVAMGEVAWTTEFGLLGISHMAAERTSETGACVCGELLTAPALCLTLELLVVPGCAGETVYRATGLQVATAPTRPPPGPHH